MAMAEPQAKARCFAGETCCCFNSALRQPGSERASPGEQVEDQDNNGENKHEVDPTAKGVAADEAENPENDKNNGDGPKHGMFS
jgi:hypothetical protein